MVSGRVELILGIKRDPHFGSTIAFGLGGEMVEAIRCVSLGVVPLSEQDASDMVREIAPLKTIVEKICPGLRLCPDFVAVGTSTIGPRR